MELDKINEEYKQEKKEYEQLTDGNKKLTNLSVIEFDAWKKLQDMKAENERQEILGEKKPYSEQDIKDAEKSYQEAYKQLVEYREKIQTALNKVNSRFEELEKNPEMKKALDTILAKRMERSIKKDAKRLNALMEVKQIFTEHPEIVKTVKGVINLREKVEEAKKELDDVKANGSADEVQKAEDKLAEQEKSLSSRENEIKTFLSRKYPNLSEDATKALFDLRTQKIDRVIKSVNKHLDRKQNAYKELTGQILEVNIRKVEPVKEDLANGENQNPEYVENQNVDVQEPENATVPAKLPWWRRAINKIKEFVKGKQEEPEAETEQKDESKGAKKEKDTGYNFREQYKSELVQDYIQKREKDLMKRKPQKEAEEPAQEQDDEER